MLASGLRKREQSGEDAMTFPELNKLQFSLWANLLEQRLGIAVGEQRKAFLSSRLRMRMRELGLSDYQSYFELVSSSQQGAVEWSYLLDRLTIHETQFLRHPASFRLIEEHYLPQLLKQRGRGNSIRAWSVGCASGEEAYTLAMLLERVTTAHHDKLYYGVIGTDVSLESLALARRGEYPASQLGKLDGGTISRFFATTKNGYRISERVRQRVAFSQLNVLHLEQAPFEPMDIIFCQNLLIYFSQQKRREIVMALTRFLKPGGLLLLGIGELVGWNPEGLEPLKFEDTLAYRRIKD